MPQETVVSKVLEVAKKKLFKLPNNAPETRYDIGIRSKNLIAREKSVNRFSSFRNCGECDSRRHRANFIGCFKCNIS